MLCMYSSPGLLLGHVAHDQAQIFIGNQGPDSHMAFDGQHHAWRKLVRRLVTASAVGSEPLLALDAEVILGARRLHRGTAAWRTRRLGFRTARERGQAKRRHQQESGQGMFPT